jgi:hypothetical protein
MPRLEVAIISRDGEAQVVNAARPASLVAFGDHFDGKMMPDNPREVAWLVHNALEVTEPLEEWLKTLEDISAAPDDVRLARRILAGDETARKIALGELPPEEKEESEEEEPDNGPPPDPALEQLETLAGGSRSPE